MEHTATGSEGSEGSGKKVVILPDKSIATAPDAEVRLVQSQPFIATMICDASHAGGI